MARVFKAFALTDFSAVHRQGRDPKFYLSSLGSLSGLSLAQPSNCDDLTRSILSQHKHFGVGFPFTPETKSMVLPQRGQDSWNNFGMVAFSLLV
jgi:hypothetical protein